MELDVAISSFVFFKKKIFFLEGNKILMRELLIKCSYIALDKLNDTHRTRKNARIFDNRCNFRI